MAEPQDVTYWSYVELIASSSSQCGLAGIPDDRRVSVVLGDVAPNSYQIGIGALMSQAPQPSPQLGRHASVCASDTAQSSALSPSNVQSL
jgi:hypothetical protein